MPGKEEPFKPFDDVDFSVFEEHKRRDPFYNETRLRVKRKLAVLGKILEKSLPGDLKLKHRTSLSHPYSFNSYYVASQWVYFARSEKDRKALKKHLGAELGADLDPNYIHLLLMVEIDVLGLTVALRIHNKAWWDGENLKKKCRDEGELEKLLFLLNPLEGFILSIHDWKKEYICGKLKKGDLINYFKYYIPGDHWLHLRSFLPREDPLTGTGEMLDWIREKVVALVETYQFIGWTPENNFLF